MYLLNSVACLFFVFLNELVWFRKCDLKGPSVSRTYVSVADPSSFVTEAWYTTVSVRHFPDYGQLSFFRQLHVFYCVVVDSLLLVLASTGHLVVSCYDGLHVWHTVVT